MTDLIEVQTSTLAGAALDWTVAQVEGIEVAIAEPHYGTDWRVYRPESGGKYSPSTDWAVGGPLIDKHVRQLKFYAGEYAETAWRGETCDGWGEGPTPLVAACRSILAAEVGDTVQVPKELIP